MKIFKVSILIIILFVLLAFLTACERSSDMQVLPPTAANPPAPTVTMTASGTATVTSMPTQTATATITQLPCLSLHSPENGQHFSDIGLINFSWEEQPGAALYKIMITFPSGEFYKKEFDALVYDRFLESLPLGGEYTWKVTAIDAGGNTICISDSISFTKVSFVPPSTPGQPAGSRTDPGGPGSDPGDIGD